MRYPRACLAGTSPHEREKQAGGGATFVLELPGHVRAKSWRQNTHAYLDRIEAMGWNVSIVSSMEELVQFAREFSGRNYTAQQPSVRSRMPT